MVGFDEFHTESSQIDGLSEGNHNPLRGVHHLVLRKFVLNQSDGQLCSVNRNIDLLENIRQRSDVVLMSVCDDKALDLVDVVLQIGDIRDDTVDSEHVILRKGETAVHHNDTVLIFEGSNVHSDLLQAAQRDNFQSGAGYLCFFSSCFLLFRQFVPVLSYGSPYIPEESHWLRSDPDTACGAVAGSPFWRAFHPLPP